MNFYEKCKCGYYGTLTQTIECGMARCYVECEKCGRTTKSYSNEGLAIEEWNKMNRRFPECGECNSFNNGKCEKNNTVTQKTWTCPDHKPKGMFVKSGDFEKNTDIRGNAQQEEETPSERNSVACEDVREDVSPVDWKTEFEKLACDYYQLSKKNKNAQEKWTYWFEQHNEAQEKIVEQGNEIKYWTGEYNKVVQENEKLKMKMDQIKEVVE